jgi:UDP-glucose 4-epimerase
LREIIAALEAALGRKMDINWKPGRPIDVPTSILSIDRARMTLGWAPKTPFEEGLKQTAAWWRERTKA